MRLSSGAAGRDLQALEMYESALRDFSEGLKEEDKRDVLLVIKLLYNSVGTIEIVGSEPGATVQLDHMSRGELPLGAPLRVSRDAHTVRVVKEGYAPFEQRLDVAGGTTVQATARLSRIQEIRAPAREPRRLTAQPLDASLRGRKGSGPRYPPHFLVEVSALAPLLMSLDGDASAGCMGTCSEPLGYGAGLVARGGYDIAGLSFGVSAGYVSMEQAVRGRSAKVEVVGEAPRSVSVNDALALRGALLGAGVRVEAAGVRRHHDRVRPRRLRLVSGRAPHGSSLRAGHACSGRPVRLLTGVVIVLRTSRPRRPRIARLLDR